MCRKKTQALKNQLDLSSSSHVILFTNLMDKRYNGRQIQFSGKKRVPLNQRFLLGIRNGIPICLGYLSVSFGFGILAVKSGLSAFAATIISFTNLTSAGQTAGIALISAGSSLVEMALTQLTINLRYALMAISLSQKLDGSFTTFHRLVAAYGITDEIYAVSSSQLEPVSPSYMYGLIFISTVGWVIGTLLGAVAGQILPASLTNAMGIVLYGMFLAIIIPPARKERSVLFAVLLAAGLSVVFYYCIPALSVGFSVIISSVCASAAAALLFPREEV